MRQSSTGTDYQSTVTYVCDVGHETSGSTTLTCQADHQWSGTTGPDCTGIFELEDNKKHKVRNKML